MSDDTQIMNKSLIFGTCLKSFRLRANGSLTTLSRLHRIGLNIWIRIPNIYPQLRSYIAYAIRVFRSEVGEPGADRKQFIEK